MKKIFTLLVAALCYMSMWAAEPDFQVGDLYYKIITTNEVELVNPSSEVYEDGGWHLYSPNEYSELTVAHIPAEVEYDGSTYHVTAIENYAFHDSEDLREVTIPASVTSIGRWAFDYCMIIRDKFINLSSLNALQNNYWGARLVDEVDGLLILDNEVVDCITDAAVISIPDGVTAIGDRAFRDRTKLTSITIPNSVMSIGYRAFDGCSGLTSITIPNGVTSIESNTFYNCSSLTSVIIPNGITSIGYDAFYNCSSLTSITIPESVEEIANGAFNECWFLEDGFVNKSNLNAEENNYWGASIFDQETDGLLIRNDTLVGSRYYITAANIPETVKVIINGVFYNCKQLTSITIPSSVTSIEWQAFNGCSLARANFVNNSSLNAQENDYWGATIADVEIDGLLIRNDTVVDCRENVTSVIIPNSVTTIGNWAFGNCSSLTSITIPNSVKSIEEWAFCGCSGLTSMMIPNSVTSIGKGAFASCSGLTSITIPNSVMSIGYRAFDGCSGLTSVTIPNSVTSIGNDAFTSCSALASIVVEEGNTVYDSRENCNAIIETASNKLLYGCYTSIIPDGITSIGDYAFFGHKQLASISIPSSVIYIGIDAFYNTKLLNNDNNYEEGVLYIDNCLITTNYDLPEGHFQVKDDTRLIAGNALAWRYNITSISIPESVQTIGAWAFYYCRNLQVVTIPSSITNIEQNTFYNCSALDTIYMLPNTPPALDSLAFDRANQPVCVVPCGSLAAYEASLWADYTKRFVELCATELIYTSTDGNIVVPYNAAAFDAKIISNTYANGQGTILFSNPITHIGELAFRNCSNLTSITIPESVTTIGRAAFRECTALTRVELPEGLEYLDTYIFAECSSLEYLSIPSTVEFGKNDWAIGNIYESYNLKTLIVPASFFAMDQDDYNEAIYEEIPYLPAKLENLVINSGEVPQFAFDFIKHNSKTLKSIDLAAATNTSIAEKAFYDCYKMEHLALPSGLEVIPYMAVAECMALTSFDISASVVKIDNRAFENCRLLSEVNFAEDGALVEIGNWAFYNCHELKNLVIPEGVTSLGYAAFYGCTYLKEVTMPSTLQSVADNGFALCEKLSKMNVNAITPPVVEARTFENVDRSIPVIVPTESVSAYKCAPVWQEFDIQGKDPVMSDLENTQSQTVNSQKIIRNGQLIIIRDGIEYNTVGIREN